MASGHDPPAAATLAGWVGEGSVWNCWEHPKIPCKKSMFIMKFTILGDFGAYPFIFQTEMVIPKLWQFGICFRIICRVFTMCCCFSWKTCHVKRHLPSHTAAIHITQGRGWKMFTKVNARRHMKLRDNKHINCIPSEGNWRTGVLVACWRLKPRLITGLYLFGPWPAISSKQTQTSPDPDSWPQETFFFLVCVCVCPIL